MAPKVFLYPLIILAFSTSFLACKKNTESNEKNPFIYANTSGVISRKQPVKVVFADNMVDSKSVGGFVASGAVSVSPSVKGNAVWQDEKTIVFTPMDEFVSDKQYDFSINIGALQDNVPKEFRHFNFNIRTIRQDAAITESGWDTPSQSDYTEQTYKGAILTADEVEASKIEALLTASIKGQSLSVAWNHDSKGVTHNFTIRGIKRNSSDQKMEIRFDGKPIGVNNVITREVPVAPLTEFKVHDIYFSQDEDFFFIINFTDPVSATQNLGGMITIDGFDEVVNYSVQNNNILVYPSKRITGEKTVRVAPSVLNSRNESLGKPWSKVVNFLDTKPAVRFAGKGNIMPESDGLILPFEAINLNAVDVEIVKIFSDNVLQYYQNYNGYEDSYEINRVGRIILQQKIQLSSLNSAINKSSWVRYGLDLNKLITTDRNSIYQVRIGFRRAYTSYLCKSGGDWKERELSTEPVAYGEEPVSIYDHNYDGFAEEYDEDYNWLNRENPCKPMYYNKDNFIAQSVYKSNIGLIVKGNDNGNFFVAATNLLTAKPLSGVEIKFYDFQQQVIDKGLSNGEGFLNITLKSRPFMAIAEKDGDKSYLLLDDGRSLSLSKFDVGGDSYQKGLKGYLYAERGIWRPGDSIFLNCIIEDKLKTLPASHPIQLEWRDPRNTIIARKTYNYTSGSILPIHLATSPDAPTGVWAATVKVGGATFTKLMSIETVKPNRLKIKFDVDKKQLMAGQPLVNASLNAAWLIGTVAGNLRAVVDANIRVQSTPFTKYSDFIFSNSSSGKTFEKKVFEGNTDASGNASLKMNINLNEEIHQISNIVFKTTVFEQGGNFSVDYTSETYSPFKVYVGVSVPHNQWGEPSIPDKKNAPISAIVVDQNGNPLSGINATINVYKVDWRWWWESDYSDANYYTGDFNEVPLAHYTGKTKGDGKIMFDFRPPAWGRYLIKVTSDASPHVAGTFIYSGYPDYADAEQMSSIATSLPLGIDSKEVKVGETINLSFTAAAGSKALVTIEGGSSIVEHKWFDCKEGVNEVSIKTTDAMGSNAYAFVTLMQPHKHPENDMPLRMYGVLPFKIVNPALVLNPVISMPQEIQPDKKAEISVSEQNGNEMYYTIAVVDEGLLDITKFKTPNPYNFFYAKSALAVRTWDLFDYVLGAYSGKLNGIFAVGGDMAAAQIEGAPKANRFVPAVVNLGPFKLKKGEKARHHFTIKNYIGSMRAMVVACNDKAFGAAQQSVKVVKPLMVTTTLPRVLSPGETFNLPVNVFVTKNNIRNVTVKINDKNGYMSVTGSSSKSLTFESSGEKMVYFPVTVSKQEGVSSIDVTATSGNESSTETVEIQVRNPNLPIVTSKEYVLNAGQSVQLQNLLSGMESSVTSSLEFSTFPSIDLSRNLTELIDYPYGCLEQTISKAFPQLFLKNLTVLSKADQDRIKSMVEVAMNKLPTFQKPEGWFAFWPGSNFDDPYTSIYAGQFMLEAKKAGFNVPQGSLETLISSQRRAARLWQPKQLKAGLYPHNADIDQAYRLYMLALAGSPEIGAMNQLKELNTISVPARYYLSAAYSLSGKKDVSAALIEKAELSTKPYREFGYSFGSDLRDEAIMLNALTLAERKENAASVAKSIAKKLSGGYWYATYSKSYGIWAVATYLAKYPPAGSVKASYTVNGKTVEVNESSAAHMVEFGSQVKMAGSKVVNKSKGVLYVTMVQKGKPALTDQTAIDYSLALSIKYTDKSGNRIDPVKLKKGTEFYAIATVKNTAPYEFQIQNLALTQIFPSGWEIVNDRMQAGMATSESSYLDYQDIRDDRVNTFFSLYQGAEKSFKIKLIAAYAGKSYVPAASCSAMYDNTISARVPGKWVTIE